jgi:hypothetical protein
MKRICIFCGSSPGHNPAYALAARTIGRALAERQLALVFGGGRVGLMGAVADACLEAGGEVIGVIPKGLATKELAHGGLSDLRVVEPRLFSIFVAFVAHRILPDAVLCALCGEKILTFPAFDSPATIGGDALQSMIGIDGRGMPDRFQHVQIALVRIAKRE